MTPCRSVTFVVVGTPGPQGSKSFKGMSRAGHAILTESSKLVKPWRQAVTIAALEQRQHLQAAGIEDCFHGPIALELTFALRRPKGAPKRVVHPATRPDISKLARSTEDALVDAGIIEDDSRIVKEIIYKRFCGHPSAMTAPGCIIEIRSLEV